MKNFIRGALCYSAILSLWQDLIYKNAENYANRILNGGWIDRSITIPLAIIWLLIVYLTRNKPATAE